MTVESEEKPQGKIFMEYERLGKAIDTAAGFQERRVAIYQKALTL